MEKLKKIICETNIILLIAQIALYMISYFIISAALGFGKIAMMLFATVTTALALYMNSKQFVCEYSKIERTLRNNKEERVNEFFEKYGI